MFGGRRSRSSRSSDSPSGDGSGPSQPSERPVVTLVSKATGGFELSPSEIVLDISKQAYRSRMSSCWPHWDSIPPHILQCIWQDFIGAVDLQSDDLVLCRNYWMKKMRKNYRDSMSALRVRMKKPDWMGVNVWEAWNVYWNTEEFKTQSERNTANRLTNPSTHRAGSKSFQRYRQEMQHQRSAPVSYMDVFTRTHAIEHQNEDGTISYKWKDTKSQRLHENFVQQRDITLEGTGRMQLSTDKEDAIFDAITDPTSRGRRYGYGNQETNQGKSGFKKAQDQAEIENLRARVAELEERDRRRSAELTQLLDSRIAEYMQQHGTFPSSVGSDDGDDLYV